MKYKINIVVYYTYEVEASSLGAAEDKGIKAFEEDETVGDVYGELYCIDSLDDDGEIEDSWYYC